MLLTIPNKRATVMSSDESEVQHTQHAFLVV